MKRLIILFGALSAVLLLSLYCGEWGHEYDNPWDEKSPNYNGGSRTIKFDPNVVGGGIASPASSKTNKYKKLDSLPTLTRDGYTFGGWYTAKTGGTSVTTNTTFEGDATLYARWTLKTYEITFNATGGTVSSASGTTGNGWKLESLPTPTKNGYTFDSWYTSETGGTKIDASKVYNDNSTIYAQWKINTYEITFNANGSGGTVTPKSAMTGDGWQLTSLPEPTRTGFTFDGWYTTATGGDYVTVDWVYSEKTTIYARWEAILPTTYTVTFNSQSGSSVSSQNVEDGKKVSKPADPTRTGYTFGGWYKESGCTNAWNFDTDVVTTAITLYAKWSVAVVYGNSVNYGGKTYKTIKIGNLTWFAENLNYDVDGSVCYANNTSNCATYGRLYNWNAAMTACPTGWHLPSDAEWTQLENAVGGSSTAGKKLKSTSGWNSNGNGTDDYGFAALPAGAGYSDVSFDGAGYSDVSFDGAGYAGYWWSATEYYAGYAYYRVIDNYEYVNRNGNNKTILRSVRCVQD